MIEKIMDRVLAQGPFCAVPWLMVLAMAAFGGYVIHRFKSNTNKREVLQLQLDTICAFLGLKVDAMELSQRDAARAEKYRVAQVARKEEGK